MRWRLHSLTLTLFLLILLGAAVISSRSPAGWREVGPASARAGGISQSNSGARIWIHDMVAVPAGDLFISWGRYTARPASEIDYISYIHHWDGERWRQLPLHGLLHPPYFWFENVRSLAASPDGKLYALWQGYSRQQEPPMLSLEGFVAAWDGRQWQLVGENRVEAMAGRSPRLLASGDMLYVAAYVGSEISVARWNGREWQTLPPPLAEQTLSSLPHPYFEQVSLTGAPDGTIYLAWVTRATPGNVASIYVLAWNGTAWLEVGEGSASGHGVSGFGEARKPSLAMTIDGMLCLGWLRYVFKLGVDDYHEKIEVKCWTGSDWQSIGMTLANGAGNYDARTLSDPNLLARPDGSLLIAWIADASDRWHGAPTSSIYVQEWTGQGWEDVAYSSAKGQNVSMNLFGSYHPVLASGGEDAVYVAWVARRLAVELDPHFYYSRSRDGWRIQAHLLDRDLVSDIYLLQHR
jgi:hypothetical protein